MVDEIAAHGGVVGVAAVGPGLQDRVDLALRVVHARLEALRDALQDEPALGLARRQRHQVPVAHEPTDDLVGVGGLHPPIVSSAMRARWASASPRCPANRLARL